VVSTSKKSKKEKKSFENLMDELEEIVGQLESGDLPLEESISLFEQGMKLANESSKKLDVAEQKVEKLLREDGQERKVPFEEEDQEQDGS
jgi:exodeoxyribonuclease VII small subunit